MGLSLAIALHETGKLQEAMNGAQGSGFLPGWRDDYYARLAAIQADCGETQLGRVEPTALTLAETGLIAIPRTTQSGRSYAPFVDLFWKIAATCASCHRGVQEVDLLDSKGAQPTTISVSVLAKSGDLKDAIEEFREAIRLDAKNGAAYHNLGLALRDSRNFLAPSGHCAKRSDFGRTMRRSTTTSAPSYSIQATHAVPFPSSRKRSASIRESLTIT